MSTDCESVVSPSLGSDTLSHPLSMTSTSIRSERHSHSGISYEGRVSLISPMNSYEATMRAAFSLDQSPNSLSSPNLYSPPFSATPNHLNHSNSLHFPFSDDNRRTVLPIQPQNHSTPGSSRGNYGSSFNQYQESSLYSNNVSIKQENIESSPPSFGSEHVIDSESNSNGQSNENVDSYENSPLSKFQNYQALTKNTFSSRNEANLDISTNEKTDVTQGGDNNSDVGSPYNSQENDDRPCSPESDQNFLRDTDTDPTSLMNTYLDTTQENFHHGENSKSLKCNYCAYSTDSRTEFGAHLSTHFDHKCMRCEFTTQTVEQLKVHLKEEHDLSPEDVDDLESSRVPRINSQGKVKTFKCKQCGYVAITKGFFWEHAKTHIKSEKILACSKCPFVTEYKHHLEYHMRNHFGSKPYKCNKCSYSCVNKSMLNSHMKSHSNIYQYRCSDCTYATKYCHSLKLHLRKYGHTPAMVLNPDGTPNPVPIIDIYGTRRGPKLKKDENGMPILPPQYQLQAQFVRAHMEVTGTIPPAPTVPSDKHSNKGNNAPVMNLPIPPAPFTNPFQFPGSTQNYPSFIPNEFRETGVKTNHKDENKDCANDSEDKEEKLNVSKSPEVQELLNCDICNFSTQSKDILSHHMMLHMKEREESEKREMQNMREKQNMKHPKETSNHDVQKEQLQQMPSQVIENPSKHPQQTFVPHFSAAQNTFQEYFARAMNPLLYPTLMGGPNFVHPALEFQQQLQRLVYQTSKEQKSHNTESSLSLSPIKLTQGQTETVLDLSKEQTPPSAVSSSQQPSSTSPSFLPASPPNSDVSTPPAKSRRKGRAFKLERIALRLSGSEEGENSCSESSDTVKEQEGKRVDGSEVPPLVPMEISGSKKNEQITFNGKWKEAHQCQYCDIAFKDIVMYTMHMGYHGYKNPFTCNMCGYDAADKVAFFLHIGRSSHL